jgi:hypothetical protein
MGGELSGHNSSPRTGLYLTGVSIGGIVKPADPHCTGMGRAHGAALAIGGGAGGAAIRRDVARYRESFAAVFGGGFWRDGF